jgi:hypothetical protein
LNQTFDTTSTGTFYGYAKTNNALTLTSDSNPTTGNGTVKIKLWYTIETIG